MPANGGRGVVSSTRVIAPEGQRTAGIFRRWGLRGAIVLLVFAVGLFAWAWQFTHRPAPVAARYLVSQRGREFSPNELNIKQGDLVRIVNDDGDLTHHAYIASSQFNFDSGDQAPGHDVNILFTVPGTFNVLCGIHPKMRLTVTVH